MDKIEELLTRGVDSIYPTREELEKVLRSGKKLKLFQGFDPTGTQLHIGHMVGLRKLAQWQKAGHHVIFLIGDGTVLAGDPSGKLKARERLLSLIVGSNEDKPGILRKVAELFEIEGINMTGIDSLKADKGAKFKINLDNQTQAEAINRVIKSLLNHGFFVNDEFRENAKDYVKQAGKIVNFKGENPVEILYNGDWLKKLGLIDILDIAGHFSLQQLSERDLFAQRVKKGEDVNLREFLYPLLQGYDSVAMEVDLELGGSDQMFNMLAGRKLVKEILNKDKFVMTTPLLTDSQGAKIGKTEGNVIALTDKPEDLFGKIMALSDDVITKGLEYLTDVPMIEIKEIEQNLEPVKHKKLLAFEIVKQLNNESLAKHAQEEFERTVQNKELPKIIPEFAAKSGATIADALVQSGTVSSNSELRRLAQQKGIHQDGKTVGDIHAPAEPGTVVQVGKHRFVKIKSAQNS